MTTQPTLQPAINWPEPGQAVVPESVAAAGQLIVAARDGGRTIGGPLATHQWDFTRLNNVVKFSPTDLLISTQTGCTLAGLQQQVNAAELWLPIGTPGHDDQTIASIVSRDLSLGWLSHRYSTAKDWITALSAIDDQGQLVKSGAEVVKNVAGYQLAPLYQGSFDLLGPLVELSFRLLPLPAPITAIAGHWDSPNPMLEFWDSIMGDYFDWLALRMDCLGRTIQMIGMRHGSNDAVSKQLTGATIDRLDKPAYPLPEPALPFMPQWQIQVMPSEMRRLVHWLAGQDLLFTAYPLSGIITGGSKGRTQDTELLAKLKPMIGIFGHILDLTSTQNRVVLHGTELELFRRVKNSLDPDGIFGPLELDD